MSTHPRTSFLDRVKNGLGLGQNKKLSPQRSGALQIHDLVKTGATFDSDPNILFSEFLRGRHRSKPISSQGLYPEFFDTNPKTLDLLEALVRHINPEVVLESGVANGASTRRILSALSQNLGSGKLISCDIDNRVATAELMANPLFEFVHISSKKDFSDVIERLAKIDLFYHDSNHSYDHQIFEYLAVWEKIPEGGILLSDDVNWSYAFLDFCAKVSRVPYVLSDTEKFSGFIQK